MTLVVDASTVVAALLSLGTEGQWAEEILSSDLVSAPHHLPIEVTAVLRRRVLAGEISDEAATAAISELVVLPIAMYAYEPLARRVWELRRTTTVQDACYVALAETLDCSLATLDLRLTRAPGPRCEFVTPPV